MNKGTGTKVHRNRSKCIGTSAQQQGACAQRQVHMNRGTGTRWHRDKGVACTYLPVVADSAAAEASSSVENAGSLLPWHDAAPQDR
eukprot:1138603-Pelagomonas_calceolata.AAC.3